MESLILVRIIREAKNFPDFFILGIDLCITIYYYICVTKKEGS
nr:MAG TPA: hypothetical protein [Caudoviricetes sp.]